MPHDTWQVVFVFFLVTVALFSSLSASRVDRTLDDSATGSNVVRATIAKLRVANLLVRNNCSRFLYRFLREIAYVESKDGTVNSSLEQLRENGGIWRVTMTHFEETKRITDNDISFYWSALQFNRTALTQPFYTNSTHRGLGLPVVWNDVQYQNLSKPLYSATAALLSLLYIRVRQSGSGFGCRERTQQARAQTWSAQYTRNPASFYSELRGLNDCAVKTDLVFVLDSSGSVGETNYERVRTFVANFTMNMPIERSDIQVGVIVFGNEAQVVINLGQYSNRSDLIHAIKTIPYLRGSTNTPDALCKLVSLFEAEARDDTLHIAVLLTDGKPTAFLNPCNYINTKAAGAKIRNMSNILIYAIGVTNDINDDELDAIATEPEFVSHLESFSDLDSVHNELPYLICYTASVNQPSDNFTSSGNLAQGSQLRLNFEVPIQGITVRLCIRRGNIAFYASFSVPNPSSDLNDLELQRNESWTSDCNSLFIRNPNRGNQSTRRKRQSTEQMVINSSATLYIVIEGIEQENLYTIGTSIGDTRRESRIDLLWISIICVSAGGALLICILLCCISAMCCWLCVRCCSRSKKSKCKSVNFTNRLSTPGPNLSDPTLN